ncbi:YsnF/AvaK domain-containing protein [uncultured Methylobacterium sp.]|uniref:YsnF/AvaK domain-containing protein n=1 Tax=uncultured Methylobacterium sp. TaxID=157278 RepID=UPI0035CC0CA6
MTQTITAMYDNHADAVAAQAKLVTLGIPASAIKILSGKQTTQTGTTSASGNEGGVWGSLKEFFMPEEDRYAYSEGLNRGGTMLSATVEDAHAEKAYDILEEQGSVNLDEREATWRKEGWTGYAGAAGTTTAGAATGATALRAQGATEAVGARGAAVGDKDYIPVVEERLNVGKRLVDSGRVRVRSYAVSKDVSENVTLHDETVTVDRRAVDRPVTVADEALFADKTIEATEMREQAVVSKDARVVEEVGIRKDASQRTETVSDTVRHTEVEVEDERGNVTRTGTTGTTTSTTPRKPL